MQTEQIDNYLLGKMSDTERAAFEQQLAADAALRQKTALQREIINAIREQAAIEQKVRQQVKEIDLRIKRQRKIRRWAIGILSPVAVAACLMAAVLIPQLHRLQNMPSPEYASIAGAYSNLRGFSDIPEITDLMDKGMYVEADEMITASIESLGDVTPDDSQQYETKEDLLYLQAVCAINQHRLLRSKRLLRQVADMKGLHRQEAEQLLKQIRG